MEVYIIMAAVAAAMLIISGLALFGFALIKKAFDDFWTDFLNGRCPLPVLVMGISISDTPGIIGRYKGIGG